MLVSSYERESVLICELPSGTVLQVCEYFFQQSAVNNVAVSLAAQQKLTAETHMHKPTAGM